MKIAAGVEYDGSGFNGWQRQQRVRTVQECVELALSRVADHPVQVVTAGRTDTGVHATGQVIHFETHAQRRNYSWLRGANTFLPNDISLSWVQPVADDFHARFSATGRHYRYIIFNRQVPMAPVRNMTAWDCRQLSVRRMRAGARYLVGKHDFTAFRAAGCQAKTPIRTVSEFDIDACKPWIWFDICADAFLQHMVRNIVGGLTTVGASDREPEWIGTLLETRDRTQGGVTAPACGLYLCRILYPARFEIPDPAKPIKYW